MISGETLGYVLSGIVATIAVFSFVRGGFWNAKTELASLTQKLTSHEERISTAEKLIAAAPTTAAVTEIKHAVDLLSTSMAGKLDNVSLRINQGEKERTLQAHQSEKERTDMATAIRRVENILTEQVRESARKE